MVTPVTSWEKEVVDLLRLIANGSSQESNGSSQVPTSTHNLTWATPINGSVGTSAKTLLTPSSDRKVFIICNLSPTNRLLVNLNEAAAPNSALYILQKEATLLMNIGAGELISIMAQSGTINYTYSQATQE